MQPGSVFRWENTHQPGSVRPALVRPVLPVSYTHLYNKVNDIIQQASSGTGKEDGRAEGGEEDSRAEGGRAEEGRAEDVREEYGRTPVPSGDGENRDRENIRALNLTGLDREAREKGDVYKRQNSAMAQSTRIPAMESAKGI